MPEEALALDQSARDLLEQELSALRGRLRDPDALARFGQLADAVAEGSVPPEQLPDLTQVLAMGLDTGRIARVHGRAADTLARSLYLRTPAGLARAEQARAVTAALEALAGATITHVSVTADGPSGHRLLLDTDRGEVLLHLDREGVRVQSVAVDL